ncbi:MAG: hypothetical protein JWO86_320 [Myxococcaceae bacterium]|nr:hypothetical protein [Myxococcaceae bacterium]
MGVRLNITLLAFSALFACACGAAKSSGEAKGPESNPWADYKGTYATAGSGSSSSKSGAAKSAKTEVAAAEAPKSEEPAAVEEAPAPAPVAAPPPAKKGKTGGKGAKKKK